MVAEDSVIGVEHSHEKGESHAEVIPDFILRPRRGGKAKAQASPDAMNLELTPAWISDGDVLLHASLEEVRPHPDGFRFAPAGGRFKRRRCHRRSNLVQDG